MTNDTISPAVRAAAFSCLAAVIALTVWLVSQSAFERWPAAIILAVVAVSIALNQSRLRRTSTISLIEFPLITGMLILDPGLAMAVAVIGAAATPGLHGLVSRAVTIVGVALPLVVASGLLRAGEGFFAIGDPADSPILWLLLGCAAVTVDSIGHYALHGIWNRAAYGYRWREWVRDVALPCLKTDPMASLLLVPLVEIALLLDGTAVVLPIAIVLIALYGAWLTLQSTKRQIHARDVKDDFFRAIFVSLARLLEMKDPDTAIHSARVAIFARDIAETMGLSEEEQSRIHLAGLLHDVGKVGVPDEILLKPGRLEDWERGAMERHARLSAEALQGIPGFGDLVRIIYAHHERLDGSGYPEGIRGDALPMGARILGVADTFEALTSDRPYRKGREVMEALGVFDRELELFDPLVVEALRSVVMLKPDTAKSARLSDFSSEWARAARHLDVRLEDEPFVLPPEPPLVPRPAPKWALALEQESLALEQESAAEQDSDTPD